MEWQFKRDNRLLLFPGIFIVLALLFFAYEPYKLAFRVFLLVWSFFFFGYFYRLHLKKNLKSSVHRLRFYQQDFQIFSNNEWVTVALMRGSLISYWFLALQWRVTGESRFFSWRSFSLVVRPYSMKESEFRALMRILNQL